MIDTPAVTHPRAIGGRARKVIVALLLVVGVQFSMIVGHALWPPRTSVVVALLVIGVISCFPPIARRIARLLDLVRHPSARSRCIAAILITITAAIALYLEAKAQGRSFTPKYQDEFSYVIQIKMMSHGRLWFPAHPLADFFESFQFIAKPVYASIYFPGTAMLLAPGEWLVLPFWVMPLLLSAACVGLLYWIVTDITDGVGGALAAIMLLSLPTFRMVSIMALSQAPTLFLALVAIVAYLRWRETHAIKWCIVLGAALGWCVITRPVDALCIAIPITAAFLLALRGKTLVRSSLITFTAAVPFLAIQCIFNLGVTGSFLQTPFDYYARDSYPQTQYGFHGFDPSIRPVSTLPQKQKYFDEAVVPILRDHIPARTFLLWQTNYLPTTLMNDTPHVLAMPLLVVGLIGLADRPRWLLFAMFPLFVLLYFPYVFFITHYTLIATPAILLLLVLGASTIESTWPRARANLATFLALSLAMLSISESVAFKRTAADEFFPAPQLADIDNALAHLDRSPAIVLFRFDARSSPHIEPVYNIDVTWPDDAPVIRAHDLGSRNIELFRYYAGRQPNRAVYLYDRGDGTITYLGQVNALAIIAKEDSR